MTFAPTSTPATASPIASTTPATSLPAMRGFGKRVPGGIMALHTSRWFSAQALTRTSTSLAAMTGSGASSYTSLSAPPDSCMRTAFMAPSS